jgi:alginate O-acetyltransferase complex protein AlgI
MLFNSPVYIFLFLPVVIAGYFFLNRHRLITAGKAWLVLASLFFYGYWNSSYLLLIIGSMLVNYSVGTALYRIQPIDSARLSGTYKHYSRKAVFIAGLLFNLGLLAYFKYADFFIDNLNGVMGAHFPLLELALPLAISFFTFQQIAYLADCYKVDTQEYDFLNYCLFVTFFPQLIAGPIVHHKEMMPQFVRLRNKLVNWRNFSTGLFVFSLGLFKKLVVADSFAVWANTGFDSSGVLTLFEAWGASLSYTFQLYYDFSGYSDMAIGAALMLNIRLPINFNSPYKALTLQEFWRRWHMTLSRWLRDYLYIPLGGNRKGRLRAYLNLFLTFLFAGLWHGAGWTFVVWGAMHGVALMLHRAWKQAGMQMPAVAAWLMTFLFVNIAWVLFRATSFEGGLQILQGMAGVNGISVSSQFAEVFHWMNKLTFWSVAESGHVFVGSIETLGYLIVFGVIAFFLPNTMQLIGFAEYTGRFALKLNRRYAFFAAILFFFSVLSFLGGASQSEFLYFNF